MRLITSTAPHLRSPGGSTRRMMWNVMLGLVPATLVSLWLFRTAAASVLVACLLPGLAMEWLTCRWRGRRATLADGSGWITGLLLALSLPPAVPWYAAALGSIVAIGLGKMVFGGLGYNLFNPAMVGRAFLMAAFPVAMGQWLVPHTLDGISGATPLAAARFSGQLTGWTSLFLGGTAGSLGETSAVAIVLGGLWLVARGAADWRPTCGMLLAIAGWGAVDQWLVPGPRLGALGHMLAGGAMLGAWFIVTDPVTCPLSKAGRWSFGVLVGLLTMLIRLHAGYPEGVMFAVLLANAVTPLINRWTMPRPVGGHSR